MSHKHSNPQQQPTRDPNIQYAYAQALIGTRNETIPDGNAILQRGRVISKEDVQYQQWIQHLKSIGVDVTEYGINAIALSLAYTPVLPDNGVRGEIIQVMAPASKSNSENTNIVLTQPPEDENDK